MTYALPSATAASTKEDRPIFVVGFQRSGTTLLQALLGAHPRIAAPPETYFFFRVYHLRDFWGDLHDDARLRRVVHETLNPVPPLLADSGFDEATLFERLKGSDRTYRAVFNSMMADFAERHGKQRWSDKTPGQPATDAWELFPEAQIVHIVRDPRDVVASSAAMPWEQEDPAAIARRYLRFTLDNVRAGTARGPAQYMRVRYEDLCREADTTLRLVCSFLDEQYDPSMLLDPSRRQATIATAAAPWQRRALDAVAPAPRGAWQDRFGAADRARVSAIVTPMLAPYGYPSPRAVARIAGSALNAASAPARLLSSGRATVTARLTLREPEQRYAAVRRFQEEGARRVWRAPNNT